MEESQDRAECYGMLSPRHGVAMALSTKLATCINLTRLNQATSCPGKGRDS